MRSDRAPAPTNPDVFSTSTFDALKTKKASNNNDDTHFCGVHRCVGRRFEDDLDILPTKLHPTNQQVDVINQTHMDELEGDSYQYLAKDKLPAATGPRKILTQWLHQSCSALEALEIKEGA